MSIFSVLAGVFLTLAGSVTLAETATAQRIPAASAPGAPNGLPQDGRAFRPCARPAVESRLVAHDDRIDRPSAVGVWTKAGSVTALDDVDAGS